MKQYFRARTYNAWVYGSYEYLEGDPANKEPDVHWIRNRRTGSATLVDGDTVTMSIGIPDIHGKDIFIGDIVKHYNDSKNPDRYVIGLIVWDQTRCCVNKKDQDGKLWAVCADCSYEIIGNIFDNPELFTLEHPPLSDKIDQPKGV